MIDSNIRTWLHSLVRYCYNSLLNGIGYIAETCNNFRFFFQIKIYKQCKSNIVPNKEFFKKQFVGHGRYEEGTLAHNSLGLYKYLKARGFKIVECDIRFTRDNIPVLCHDENIKEYAIDEFGNGVNRNIHQMNYSEVQRYNFSRNRSQFEEITTLDALLEYSHLNDLCLELDLEKKYLGRDKYLILYELVKKHDMLSNVIWEVSKYDFESLASIDSDLIYQIDHTWNFNSIKKLTCKRKYANTIIISKWFPSYDIGNNCDVINYGKMAGFVIKCATINDESIAQSLFSQGVDLITTDTLTNKF